MARLAVILGAWVGARIYNMENNMITRKDIEAWPYRECFTLFCLVWPRETHLAASRIWTLNGTPMQKADALSVMPDWWDDRLEAWAVDMPTTLPMSWRWGRTLWKAHRWAKIRERIRESGA